MSLGCEKSFPTSRAGENIPGCDWSRRRRGRSHGCFSSNFTLDIDDRRIHFDLAEIRESQPANRQCHGKQRFWRKTTPDRLTRQRNAWLAGGSRQIAASGKIRHQIQVTVPFEPFDPVKVVHAGGRTAFVLGHHLEPHRFILAMNIAGGIDSPDLMISGRKSKLRKRDAHFEGPTFVIHVHSGLPDAFP